MFPPVTSLGGSCRVPFPVGPEKVLHVDGASEVMRQGGDWHSPVCIKADEVGVQHEAAKALAIEAAQQGRNRNGDRGG